MPKKSSSVCDVKGRLELKPGDRVIIRLNPHDQRAEDIVGTVIVFRPSAGFGGCDLVDVHYKNPRTGQGRTDPFGLDCLGSASAGELIRLAEHHERQAARLRQLSVAVETA